MRMSMWLLPPTTSWILISYSDKFSTKSVKTIIIVFTAIIIIFYYYRYCYCFYYYYWSKSINTELNSPPSNYTIFTIDWSALNFWAAVSLFPTDCKRYDKEDVHVTCQNDTATVTWPTDLVFSGDVEEAPSGYIDSSSSGTRSKTILDLVLIARVPR